MSKRTKNSEEPEEDAALNELLVSIDKKFAPFNMPPAEFLWFLKLLNVKRKTFAYEVGCTPRTVYNEMQREYVREKWSEVLENTFGAKRFRRLRREYQKELKETEKKMKELKALQAQRKKEYEARIRGSKEVI